MIVLVVVCALFVLVVAGCALFWLALF